MFEDALALLGDRVAYGAGRVRRLGADAAAIAGPAARALLVADPGVGAAGLSEPVESALAAALAPAFDAFLREVGLEVSLADRGLGAGDAGRLVAETLKPENRPMLDSNCRALDEAALAALAGAVLAAR